MVQEGTVCYLLNKPCLLELSLSVISIVCCNKTRTEGEKLTREKDVALLCPMSCGNLYRRGVWGRMDTCICMAGSLCCPLETKHC